MWPGPEAPNSSGADVEPPAYRCGLFHSGTSAERGKPVVSPFPISNGIEGKRTARQADGTAGKGGERKRMPACNGSDRGCAARQHHPTRKRADFSLVWRHERVWQTDFRERRRYVGSGNASWCGSHPWRHGLSAPGAYRGGFFRQAKAGRVYAIRPHRGTILVQRGGSTSPTADREVTAHQGETLSDGLPRGGDRSLQPPSAAAV